MAEIKPDYVWLKMKKDVKVSDWKLKKLSGRRRIASTIVSWTPQVAKNDQVYRDGGNPGQYYHYYHRELKFDVEVTADDSEGYTVLKVRHQCMDDDLEKKFRARNDIVIADSYYDDVEYDDEDEYYDEEMDEYIQKPNTCRKSSRSYAWMLSECCLSFNFVGASTKVVKRIRIGASNRSLNSRFCEPYFVPIKELKKSPVGVLLKHGEVVPDSIEILARIYLSAWSPEGDQLDFDENCAGSCSQNISSPFPSPAAEVVKLGSTWESGDITIKVESKKVLRAHKSILVTRSPVFHKMLVDCDMKEKQSGIIHLQDFKYDTVMKFIKLLYGNFQDVSIYKNLGVDKLLEVLKLAHLYEVGNICDYILWHIIRRRDKKFTSEVIAEIYMFGHLYEYPDLKYRSMQWIKRSKLGNTMELQNLLKSTGNVDLVADFAMNLLCGLKMGQFQ